MKINISSVSIEKAKSDVLVLGLFEGQGASDYSKLDKLLSGAIRKILKSKTFVAESGDLRLLSTLENLPANHILLVGLGKKKQFSLEKLRSAASQAARFCRETNLKKITFNLHNISFSKPHKRALALSEGILLGLYKFDKYKTDKKKKQVSEIILLTSKKDQKNISSALREAQILTDSTIFVRDLVNTPASELTPSAFANQAKALAKKNKLKVTVWSKDKLKKKGFNAHLAVGRGSGEESKLVIMEYGKKAKPFVLIGKGVTFDSGGLNLKPWEAMKDMKCDMAGAATVLGTLKAISELKIPVHVIGLMPLAENMPDGKSYKQGDIIKSYSGKTIEIGHTDAEGRLLLADSLGYASKKLNPQAMIDLATLTGACVVALGYHASGLITNDKKLSEKLQKAGDIVYERVWPLPLFDEYKEDIKTEVADVMNISKVKGAAGTITAGAFLNNFTGKAKWAHIDIAGPAWLPKDNAYSKAGGTGFGVRLLTKFFQMR